MQWRNEIEAHTEGFKVAIWHGSARENNIEEIVKHDVVRIEFEILTRPWLYSRFRAGADHVRCTRKRVQEAAERLQAPRQDHQGAICDARDYVEQNHCELISAVKKPGLLTFA